MKDGVTKTRELEAEIARAGITKKEIAKALGLSEMGLYRKICNQTEFKASEIAVISQVLKISRDRRDYIFFP